MTFPRSRKSTWGYDVNEVEDFLEDARRAYAADRSQPTVLTADSIRHIAFTMRKGGYSTTAVDAALERLEDAFAAREREKATADLKKIGPHYPPADFSRGSRKRHSWRFSCWPFPYCWSRCPGRLVAFRNSSTGRQFPPWSGSWC